MPRIRQVVVPALFPDHGSVHTMLFGEAPGPRGADQSGLPFWGDGAGLPVYRALRSAGMAEFPSRALDLWDGATLREAGLRPVLSGVALSNAYPRCPTRDGDHFHAPTDRQLLEPLNLERILEELRRCRPRTRLRVIVLGKRAAWLFSRLPGAPPFELVALPHPSAQGLLQAAPDKGKGLRLTDLRHAWEGALAAHLDQGRVLNNS